MGIGTVTQRISGYEETDNRVDEQVVTAGTNQEERESYQAVIDLKRSDIPDIDLFNFEEVEEREVKPKTQPRQSKEAKSSAKIEELASRVELISQKGIGFVAMARPDLAQPVAENLPSILDVVAVNHDEAMALAEFQQAWFPVKKLTKKQRERLEKMTALFGLGTVLSLKIMAIRQLLEIKKQVQGGISHVG